MNDTTNFALASLAVSIASMCAAVCTWTTIAKPRRPNRSRKTYQYKRAALLRPVKSNMDTPWVRLLSCGIDDDFLISLNFTRCIVLQRSLPYFDYERERLKFGSSYRTGPKTRGRNPQIQSVESTVDSDLLGLSLWYLKTKGSVYTLCPIFVIVPSSLSVWLDYSLEVLLRVVKKTSRTEFEIRWPDEGEMLASSLLLQNNRTNGPWLKGIFAGTDGGRMPCPDCTDVDTENAYFKGFTQGVEVTNFFVWNFYGELIHTAVNFPGSWHDTKLADASGLFYPKLSDEMTPPGFAILGDSAFVNNTSDTNCKEETNETWDIPESAALAAVDIILQRVMPSERQSAEWGVRSLKALFQPLKKHHYPLMRQNSFAYYAFLVICSTSVLVCRFESDPNNLYALQQRNGVAMSLKPIIKTLNIAVVCENVPDNPPGIQYTISWGLRPQTPGPRGGPAKCAF